jgi:hypothetical protein
MQALVSLRLALAHLQQEAGPDRRATFRAEITKGIQQVKTYAELKNPMWTGVQRTDFSFQPPSWIISGRGDKIAGSQSVSIAPGPIGATAWPDPANLNTSNPAMLKSTTPGIANYTLDQWLPWQTDYTPQNLITLVGDSTATSAEEIDQNNPLSGRPDGRVSLPAINLPDSNVAGRYCYWVGDEGVKANITLIDPRVSEPTSDAYLISARRNVGRTGYEILSEMANVAVGAVDSKIDNLSQLNLVKNFIANSNKNLWPDITVSSYGVYSDPRFGGLKIDLTRVFEMEDDAFLNSEWGTKPGATTFFYNGETSYLLKNANHSLFKDSEGKMYIPYNDKSKIDATFATVWSFPDISETIDPTNPPYVRGPTWSALRDYYRLYKQITYENGIPTIYARPVYPNTVALSKSNYPTTIAHYSQIYNRTDSPRKSYKGLGNINNASNWSNDFNSYTSHDMVWIRQPSQTGYYNGTKSSLFNRPIPIKVAVQPYIARQQLIFGLIKDSDDIYLTITPVTVLHNPYNVALKLGRQRISFRNFLDQGGAYNTLYTRVLRTYTNPKKDPETGKSYDAWFPVNGVLGLIQNGDSNANNNECMSFEIEGSDENPDNKIQPGEFRVFTANQFNLKRRFILKSGYTTQGGFKTAYLDNSKPLPKTLKLPLPTDSTLMIGLETCSQNPKFSFRHQMESWGMSLNPILGDDSLSADLLSSDPILSDEKKLYNSCSLLAEHSALPFTEQIRNGSVFGAYTASNVPFFADADYINKAISPPKVGDSVLKLITSASFPSNGNPIILGIFDYGIRWPEDSGNPPTSGTQLFARTNPMAAVTRVDSSDQSWDVKLDTYPPTAPIGYANTSVSYKLEIKDGSWPTIEADGKYAYGGSSNTSSGVTKAIYTEVPLTAPQSIAQFAHANYKLFDQSPLYGAGNSLHPLQSIWKNPFNHGALYCGGYWDFNPYLVECDENFYLNRALFDRFFLSGITSNLADFVSGKTSITDNPRSILFSNKSSDTTLKSLQNPRTAATVLLNKGQFNIHSMSIRAWASLLAGAKAKLLLNESGGANNARFPRAIRLDTANGASSALFTSPDAWNGLINLTDTQIINLAKNIVWENQFRLSFSHREGNLNVLGTGQSGWHSMFCNNNAMLTSYSGIQLRGLPPSTLSNPTYPVPVPAPPGSLVFNTNNAFPNPYIGLSQFINRHGCPHVGENGFNMGAGALHNAILHSDNEGQSLSNRYSKTISYTSGARIMNLNGPVTINTNGNPTTTPYFYIDNTTSTSASVLVGRYDSKNYNNAFSSINFGDLRIGSPTSLLPSDILAAIGSSLSTRSDTFTIRAYGDISDKPGSPASGSCWIEATVQRIPEFIDNSQNAETDVCDLSASWRGNKNLNPANQVLGRRFIITSFKILKPNEL